MEVLGLDIGRHAVKAVLGRERTTFPSKVGEWRHRNLINKNENYDVEIDREKYFVGELADEAVSVREMATRSKVHQESFILAQTAGGILAAPGYHKEPLLVVAGLPIDQNGTEDREAFKKLLTGMHTVRVNSTQVVVNIARVEIAPEGGGAFWDLVLNQWGDLINPQLASQPLVRLVDWGSRTINYVTLERTKYRDVWSGTLNYGLMELETQDAGAYPGFVRRVLGDLSKRWPTFDPQRDAVIHAGGGALKLTPWIKQYFPTAQIPDDPVYSNAAGFAKMGALLWPEK